MVTCRRSLCLPELLDLPRPESRARSDQRWL